ncbi:MAG: transcriptional regulator [Methanomethylophilus sp.]|jgi:predicted transcriptional regulator
MKTPCEIVVWYVLPTIRREIAKEMVGTYHMRQSDVGRIFGVTDAAISQYLKNKRGGSELIEKSEYYPGFLDEVRKSAKLIVEEKSDMSAEMCRICDYTKRVGLLAKVYTGVTGKEAPACAWGAEKDPTCIKDIS